MNKPNWENAPAWANWLARDHDGVWSWYEKEPYASTRFWNVADGEMMPAVEKVSDWEDTLEPKPS